MRKVYIFGLIGLAALIIGLAWAEQITFTTYYPAPYGVYKEMKANLFYANPQNPVTISGHPDVPPGEEAGWEGKMYYNDGTGGTVSKGMYCYDGTSWQAAGGGGVQKYESPGWFPANRMVNYTRFHGLGARPDIVQVWWSNMSDGSGDVVLVGSANDAANRQLTVVKLDSTKIVIRARETVVDYNDADTGNRVYKYDGGYFKIIALKIQ